MEARLLRLMVIILLMVSPLNVTAVDLSRAAEIAAKPIELHSTIGLRPPLRPLAAGAPQTITLEIAPTTLIANSGATATITATVYDLTGDLVSDVNLSGYTSPAARGTVSGLGTTTVSGTVTGTWTAGTAIGFGTIEIGNGVFSGTASITLTAGAPANVTLSSIPNSLSVGGTSALTATIVDQYNNSVGDGAIVTFTSNLGNVLSPNSTSGGIATSTITSTVAGTAHITATSGTTSGFAAVVFNPDVPQTVTVLPNPATLTVDAVSILTATVVDQYNNSIADGTIVTFTTDLGNVLSPRLTSGGIATSTITSTLAGTARITIASGTASGFAAVVFNPGAPRTVTVLRNPATLTVGGTSVLTATVADQYNNKVVNGTSVTFTTDLGNVLSPRLTSGGIATSTITSTLAGTAHITITSGTASGFAAVVFNPGVPNTVTVLRNPATLTVGGTSVLTATVADQYNNKVVNGTIVTFTTDIGNVLSPRLTSGGIATSTITSTLSGTAHITITSGTASGFTSVVFNPDGPNIVTVLRNPATLTVGGASVLTATVADQYNNPVGDGTIVTFTTNLGNVLSPRSTSGGIATSTITSTLAGTAHITITSGIASGFASVIFNPGAPYTLTVQPPTAVISAGQRITYTAIATDTYGNALGNVTASTAFSIAPASGGSFAGSVVTPTIMSTWLVTGVNGPAVNTATLTVTAAAFNRLAIENAPAGSGLPVNAVTLSINDTLVVYAAAYDVYSNLIGGRSVTWGSTGVVAGNLAPTTGITTAFTPIVSGTGIITAIANGITDTTGIITVQAPLLRISKTASPSPVNAGDQLHYTIGYTNSGNAATQGGVITETLPPSTTFFLSVPPRSGDYFWSIPPLAPGASDKIDVYLTVASQMPISSVLTNTVRFGASKVTPAITTTATQVNSSPKLVVSIAATSDPYPVRPDQTFSYIINYSNIGSAGVAGLRITETYPSYITFLSANPSPISGTNNVWITNTLNNDSIPRFIVVNVKAKIPAPDQTILDNKVSISANEAAPYTFTHQTLLSAPMLRLAQSITPLTPTANRLLTYTLLYTNSGSSYAANTTITDALPINTSFVQCWPTGCEDNGGIVQWNLGQVDQQTAQAVTMTVRVSNNLPNGTVITNTARITSTDQVSAWTQLTSTVSSAPDVTLSKSDGVTGVTAGQLITYTLIFANIGTAPAANVVITDHIPDYTTFAGCLSCVAVGGGVYSFTRGTLNANDNSAVTLSARVAMTLPAGLRAITNTATIATTTGGDPIDNNDAQDVDGVSTRPALDLGVRYDSSTPYPGKVVTYTIYYTNTSAMDTIGVVITTTRPAWLAGPPAGWNGNNSIDQYPIGNLAAGQNGTITYVVTLPVTYTLDMTAFSSIFMIQDGGPGGLPIAGHANMTIIGVPDLNIAQVIVPPAIVLGKKFSVTLVISNSGLGRACNPKALNCGGFFVDAFVDPGVPPPSYPFQRYGDPYASPPPIAAGTSVTVVVSNLVVTPTQHPILYFKVDNFDCSPSDHSDPCLPSHSSGGLVPEYNETNNVAGPITVYSYRVYLPLVRR